MLNFGQAKSDQKLAMYVLCKCKCLTKTKLIVTRKCKPLSTYKEKGNIYIFFNMDCFNRPL